MSLPRHGSAALSLDAVSWGNGILHPVSVNVQPGRILGVLGPNGAGKSTLLRLIYRYYRPRTGRVLINGTDIHAMTQRQVAQRVAAVLQEQPSDFSLKVAEVVALGRAPHRERFSGLSAHDHDLVAQALDRLDLKGLAHRSMGALSGGERQRVMVARALAQEPSLIVLDEPTNHLDIHHQLQVLQLIRSLGITVVASLHDLNLVHGFTDDLLVLENGYPLAVGTTAEIFTPQLIAQAFCVRAVARGAAQFEFSLFQETDMESTA